MNPNGNNGMMMINPFELFSKGIIGEFQHDLRYLEEGEDRSGARMNSMLEKIAVEAVRDGFKRKDVIFLMLVEQFDQELMDKPSPYESQFREIEAKRRIPTHPMAMMMGSNIPDELTREVDFGEAIQRMLGHITGDLIDGAKGELAENGLFLPRYTTSAEWLRSAGLTEEADALDAAKYKVTTTAESLVDMIVGDISGNQKAQSQPSAPQGIQNGVQTMTINGREAQVHMISAEELMANPEAAIRGMLAKAQGQSAPKPASASTDTQTEKSGNAVSDALSQILGEAAKKGKKPDPETDLQ